MMAAVSGHRMEDSDEAGVTFLLLEIVQDHCLACSPLAHAKAGMKDPLDCFL